MNDSPPPFDLAASKYPESVRPAFKDAVDAARNLVRFLRDVGEDIAEMTPEDVNLFSEGDLEFEEDQEEYSALEKEYKEAFFSFLDALEDNVAGTQISPEIQDSIQEGMFEIVLPELSPAQEHPDANKESITPVIEPGILAQGNEWREKLHRSGQIERIVTGPDDSSQYNNHTFLQVMLHDEALPRNDALRKHAVDELGRQIQQMALEAGLEPDDVKVQIPLNRPPWIEFIFDNDEMAASPEGAEMIFSVLDPKGIKRLAPDEQSQPRPDWLSDILEKGTFSGRKIKNDRDSLYDAEQAFDMAQQEFREAIQMGRELIASAETYDFQPTEKIKELFRVVSDEEYATLAEEDTESLSKHPDVLITGADAFTEMQKTDPRNSKAEETDPEMERVFLGLQRTVLTNVIGSMLEASEEIGQAFKEYNDSKHGRHESEETGEIYESQERNDDRHMDILDEIEIGEEHNDAEQKGEIALLNMFRKFEDVENHCRRALGILHPHLIPETGTSTSRE